MSTAHKLLKHNIWTKVKALPLKIRILNNAKPPNIIRLKLKGIFHIFTKLVLETKASVCSAVKEDLLLYCRKFSAFFIVVIA